MIAEVVATFFLSWSRSAGKKRRSKAAALTVGLTVVTCGFFVGPISVCRPSWLYAVGPCIGAALGALAVWALVRSAPTR